MVTGFLMISRGVEVNLHFKRQPHKILKHTQTIRRLNKLFECVRPFCVVDAKALIRSNPRIITSKTWRRSLKYNGYRTVVQICWPGSECLPGIKTKNHELCNSPPVFQVIHHMILTVTYSPDLTCCFDFNKYHEKNGLDFNFRIVSKFCF